MNIVLLNPPHKHRIQRRYMCSYNAPNFLLPPMELTALGGIAKQFSNCSVTLIDAIAENLNTIQTKKKIKAISPDIIVSIHGFECFDEDIKTLEEIKSFNDTSLLILFGHYATLFPEEILINTHTDIIIHGEPDLVFKNILTLLTAKENWEKIANISFRKDGNIVLADTKSNRVTEFEELPVPAYEMLNHSKYFEPFLSHPFGLIQSARGCPYSCNYCVRTFGKKLTYRTSDQILDEIILLKQKVGIKSLRFIDDTFTANTKRVYEICDKLITADLNIEWTCLSRLDTIQPDMIPLMKKAGCKRIYFGAESGSAKVLSYLNKVLDLEKSMEIIRCCRKNKIETFGFFIVGSPSEDDAAFNESVEYAINADFDYISVSQLQLYPGTLLFEQNKNLVDFSLFPYKHEWKDPDHTRKAQHKEKVFYRRFYIRPKFLINTFRLFSRNPIEYLSNAYSLIKYILSTKSTSRSDYF